MATKPCLLAYETVAGAAARTGYHNSSIHSAIGRGELKLDETADGKVRLVRVADVDAWAAQDRKPGRRRLAGVIVQD